MPQHKSCKKRMKQSAERRLKNRAVKSELKRAVKELRASGSRTEAENKLSQVFGQIDRAARKKIIPKKRADRDKSKLAIFVRGLSA